MFVFVIDVAVWFVFGEGRAFEDVDIVVEEVLAVLVGVLAVLVGVLAVLVEAAALEALGLPGIEREPVGVAGAESVVVEESAVLVGRVGLKRLAGSRLGRSDSHHCLTLGEEVHALAHALSIDEAMAEVPMVRVVLLSSASFASLRASIRCSTSST